MNGINVRITRRTELGDRGHEESIDIDFGQRHQAAERTVTLVVEGSQTAEAVRSAMTSATEVQRLEWSNTLCNGERVDFKDAEKACAALGEGWRLPTRIELESILDLTRHDPAIDTTRFPDTKSGWYWTSTPCAWSSDCAWVVHFFLGLVFNSLRDGHGAFVRAVRSVPAGQ